MAPKPYNYVDMKDWLAQRFKTLLRDAGYVERQEVRVIKADPHTEADIPCLAINLVNASESDQVLSDYAGAELDPTLNGGAGGERHYYGTFLAETLELRVWTTNLDMRDKLRVFVMAQLLGLRRELTELGLRKIQISGGRDEQDNQTMNPTPLYFAPFNITYLNPLEVWEEVELISSIEVGRD